MCTTKRSGSDRWVIGLALLLLGIWWFWQDLLSLYLTHVPPPSNEPNSYATRGVLGDSYGSLNCLFAGFALLGVVYTMFSQIQETQEREADKRQQELQRIADETRREEELKRQERQRNEDNFEQRFFRLLDIWNLYVTRLELPSIGGSKPAKGKWVLSSLWSKATHRQRSEWKGNPGEEAEVVADNGSKLADQQTSYRYACQENGGRAVLDAYFRSLYHVFRYLDRSETGQPRCEYSDIVRALLSPDELTLLALNCLEPEGAKFKKLAEDFHLLKHLDNGLKTLLKSEGKFAARAFRDDEDEDE